MARPITLTFSAADAARVRMILAETTAAAAADTDDAVAGPDREEPEGRWNTAVAVIFIVVVGIGLGILIGSQRPEWVDAAAREVTGVMSWVKALLFAP